MLNCENVCFMSNKVDYYGTAWGKWSGVMGLICVPTTLIKLRSLPDCLYNLIERNSLIVLHPRK